MCPLCGLSQSRSVRIVQLFVVNVGEMRSARTTHGNKKKQLFRHYLRHHMHVYFIVILLNVFTCSVILHNGRTLHEEPWSFKVRGPSSFSLISIPISILYLNNISVSDHRNTGPDDAPIP